MNVMPVIVRELRSQARQPFTFWLRMLGVGALLGGGFIFTVNSALTPARGAAFFGLLHLMLLCAVWILVPLGAADCLSRERREGTLGLLFLTPLRATDIVVAKGLSHGWRGLTLLVAVLPVLTIPFLLGGVTWQQAAASALINFNGLCWALSAALMASALSRSGLRALALAVLLAALGLLAQCIIAGVLLRSTVGGIFRDGYSHLEFDLLMGFAANGLHPDAWNFWAGNFTAVRSSQLLTAALESTVVSLVALNGAVWFAARRVRRLWQEAPPSVRAQQIEKALFQPVLWVSFLKRWMRWKLDRNPIGWLEQRRWSGRLVTWTWFAIVISMQTMALTDRDFFRSYQTWETLMAWMLALSLAASAAGSFRRERETGVLELLLVSPLKTGQIIGGRARGLWGQFLPSIIMLLGVWIHFAGMFDPQESLVKIRFFLVTFFILPVTGLYFSVSCRHFLTAFLLTLGAVVALPTLMIAVVRIGWWFVTGNPGIFPITHPDGDSGVVVMQLCIGVIFGALLYRRLATRSFPLERGAV